MESSLVYRERAAEARAKAATSWFEVTRTWRNRQAEDYLRAAEAAEDVETRRRTAQADREPVKGKARREALA